MPRKDHAQRLLILTLSLEAAVEQENWSEVQEILKARAESMDHLAGIPSQTVEEILAIEERLLTTLRKRLGAVRADLRNLTAALRIATPYSRGNQESTLSLAG